MNKPKIVVVIGAPAAGKTRLGRAVARKLHLAISDKDHVTGQLLAALMKDLGYTGEDYSQTDLNRFRDSIYGCMEDVAKDNLRAGMGTVIVSPYIDRDKKDWLENLKARVDIDNEADWFVVWIDILPEEALARIKKRNSPRDVIKMADWDKFASKTYWGPPSSKYLRVDAQQNFDEKVKTVVSYCS